MNECEKKSKYTEKNLNLTIKIALLNKNLYQIQSQKNLNFESGYLNFTKFQEKNLNEWQVCFCLILCCLQLDITPKSFRNTFQTTKV